MNTCSLSRQTKQQPEAVFSSPGGDRNREFMQNTSALIDTSGDLPCCCFCACSRGHHQGPVPEREVQPAQGVRRSGLPEGHVCQSQENGAEVS